jgi:pilus assembly protein FimV
MLQRQYFRLCCAIVLASVFGCTQAVELGEPLVRSHIGQPLSADIELTSLASEAASVQAALADPEVYRGANISMHPALAALNITIVRRDGKRFLRLVSPKAIDADYVHLFFSLTENGRASVRAATLWFTPDPTPAPPPPPPTPLPAAPPAVAAPRQVVAAPAPRQVVAAPVQRQTVAAPVVPAVAVAQPLACAPRLADAQIGACAAIDAKNAALGARIVELEDKVRVLTASVRDAPAAPVLKPVTPKTAPAKAAAVQPAQPAGATPWLFISIAGALMLCALGVLAYLLVRKRKGKGAGAAQAAAGLKARALIVSVRDRLLRTRKDQLAAE